MIRVKLTTKYPLLPLTRQTPGSLGVWGDVHFYVNDLTVTECDWWVVEHGMNVEETVTLPRGNTIFVTAEPPQIKQYDKKFTDQFGMIIGCDRNMKHPNIRFMQQGLPWMIGHYGTGSGVDPKDFKKVFTTYDQLKAISSLEKTKQISVITSHKLRTDGQIARRAFIDRLKAHFGDRLDVFGAGVNRINDKWDGIAPYKYHLALENHAVDDYWTEKIADTYLAGAYPFYFGAPNISNYFAKDAYTPIDTAKPDEAIRIIEAALAEELYENRTEAILSARSLVMDKYNIFAMLAEICGTYDGNAPRDPIVIIPEKPIMPLPQRIAKALRGTPVYGFARTIFRKARGK